tara:strand:- start:21855 stop:22580 length:726 start_codon:yes stop_codon:yes gene_type:complete
MNIKFSTVLFLILLLLTIIPIPKFAIYNNDGMEIEFNHLANEGYTAYVVHSSLEPDDQPPKPDPDANKCACKGTGNITHGDGHVTPCPYHKPDIDNKTEKCTGCSCDTPETYCNCINANGQCTCTQTRSKNSDARRNKQILWFTASWCQPCQQFKATEVPKLKESGWIVNDSEQAHIRVLDIDEHPEMYEKYGRGRSLPLFALLDNKTDKEIDNRIGFHTAKQIADMYNQVTQLDKKDINE